MENYLRKETEMGFYSSFTEAYKTFLTSLTTEGRDMEKLKGMCEPKFFKELQAGLEALDEEAEEISILNAETEDFKLELVYFKLNYWGYFDRFLNVKGRSVVAHKDTFMVTHV